MYLVASGKSVVAPLIGRGEARGAEFVRGAHRETELRKKLKPTQPANSSVRPWKGGVPIYKVQFGGGANYLLASNTPTAPVQVEHEVAQSPSHRHRSTPLMTPLDLHTTALFLLINIGGAAAEKS